MILGSGASRCVVTSVMACSIRRHSGSTRSVESGIHIHRRWLWIPGSRAFGPRPGMTEASIQRLDLDDRGAVVAADPEHRPRAAIVDEDAADIGRARQLIFGDGVGLRIKAGDAVGQHRAGPDLA